MKPPQKTDILPIQFYEQPTEVVARELIGKTLIRRHQNRWLGGLIVETEAYLGENDLASHSHRGITNANAAMFEAAGTFYVYPIHTHCCFNIVTEKAGAGCAVLIRAVEPIWGTSEMMTRRQINDSRNLMRGPGRLCQALDINRSHNHQTLQTNRTFRIAASHDDRPTITATKRIGITRDKERMLRFIWDGNWYVSGRAGDHVRKPLRR